MYALDFTITNLTCEACIKVTTMTLKKLPGVVDVQVQLDSGKAHVTSEQPIQQGEIEELLQDKGYTVAF